MKATNRPSALMSPSSLLPAGSAPPVVRRFTLTRWVVPATRSCTKMSSSQQMPSSGARPWAAVWNTTYRPSALMDGFTLARSACSPALPTLTRCVVPATRSRTKTSVVPLVSPATRLDASDSKATNWPSPLIAGPCPLLLPAFPTDPSLATLTSSVVPAVRSRTNTLLPGAPGARLVALEKNATYRPSVLSAGAFWASPDSWPPALVTLTRSVVPPNADASYRATTSPITTAAVARRATAAPLRSRDAILAILCPPPLALQRCADPYCCANALRRPGQMVTREGYSDNPADSSFRWRSGITEQCVQPPRNEGCAIGPSAQLPCGA